MSAQNKSLVRRWHEEGINQQSPGLALELCSENFQLHFAFKTADYPSGAHALQHWASATFGFFPDFKVFLEDMVADGDRVAFRVAITATHGGEIFGVPPSGRQLKWDGMGIFRFENDKFAEFWWMPDLFSLMQQLDLVPD